MKDSWAIAKGILIAVGIIAVLVGGVRFIVESTTPDPLGESLDKTSQEMDKALCKIDSTDKKCKQNN